MGSAKSATRALTVWEFIEAGRSAVTRHCEELRLCVRRWQTVRFKGWVLVLKQRLQEKLCIAASSGSIDAVVGSVDTSWSLRRLWLVGRGPERR